MPLIDSSPETPLSLDNNIFTHLRKKQPYVLQHIKRHLFNTGKLPVIPSLTMFEARFGIHNALFRKQISNEQANSHLEIINNLITMHTVIAFDQKASEIAAYIFARLSKSDKNKHWRDLFIVATAVAHNFGLATQNKEDMELIGNYLPPDINLRISIWKK